MTVVGVLGAGQLGRMLALAGYPLGLRFVFYDPSAEAPAGHLAELRSSSWDDHDALVAFAGEVDLVTYEFENVPVAVASRLAERVPVHPSPRALEVAQDRLKEKHLFRDLGFGTAPFAPVDTRDDLSRAVEALGLPAVLKTRTEGYDGKGQRVLRRPSDLDPAFAALGGRPLILEGFIPFTRELSILAARGRNGDTAFWPLVENVHRDGILRLSVAPAQVAPTLAESAMGLAGRALEALDYVGVVAIELFEHEGRLVANEMAPRVHNSGHWTIEGSRTSQFENHLRALLGLPLGDTAMNGVAAMVNLIGETPDPASLLEIEGSHLHLYGKPARPGRKLGHVTLVEPDRTALGAALARVASVVDEPSLSR
ncbi:MAG TPA: 5-(carboxyamino)imidazole ribonucleotide synthase [Candidatus Polarisedimenticolaceae bacterium]|nr:5-(carboxyamino)imidazole ribonucleotide synthase [Candidatus Polarisedimenticolaceae bacterium]